MLGGFLSFFSYCSSLLPQLVQSLGFHIAQLMPVKCREDVISSPMLGMVISAPAVKCRLRPL